jgi:branched-subunit amino acid transport protein
MDTRFIIFILILGGLNYLLRFVPAILLNKFSLPKYVEEWLSFVPVATMAAVVVPSIIGYDDKPIYFSMSNPNLVCALPTVIVAWKTRSLGLTLAVGMLTMALLQLLAF